MRGVDGSWLWGQVAATAATPFKHNPPKDKIPDYKYVARHTLDISDVGLIYVAKKYCFIFHAVKVGFNVLILDDFGGFMCPPRPFFFRNYSTFGFINQPAVIVKFCEESGSNSVARYYAQIWLKFYDFAK